MRRGAWLVLVACLFLQGCGTLSGEYQIEPTDKKGITGATKNKKTKRTQAVAVSDDAKEVLAEMAKNQGKQLDLEILKERNAAFNNPCVEFTFEQVDALKADSQDTYLQNLNSCKRESMLTSALVGMTEAFKTLAQGDSDIVGVAKAFGQTIQAVAREGTNKVKAFVNPLAVTIGVSQREKTARANVEAVGFLGQSAAENAGDISIDGLAINTSQTAEASSNDGGTASSGELGTGTAGSASGTATNSSTGDVVNLNIGRGQINTAQDTARQFIDTRSTQALDTSATGVVNEEDNNIDQQNTIDDNDAELNNEPENGSNNDAL